MIGLPELETLRQARHQGPVVAALGRALAGTVIRRLGRGPRVPAVAPGPELRARVPPRPRALVDAYLRWAGGEPAARRGTLPPHLFPQWGFPLLARTLEPLPYPLARVLNAGCRLEVRAPIPDDVPLDLTAQLVSVDDDGRRVLLRQRLTTALPDGTPALEAEVQALVPLASGGRPARGREPTRVPAGAAELVRRHLARADGLAFASLTGDFNPVHWLWPYARLAGFPSTILHGFATLALAAEGLSRTRFGGAPARLREIEVRFTRPLVLPREVGLYAQDDVLWVADAPGAPAVLTGRFAGA